MNKPLFFAASLIFTLPLVHAQETATSNLARDDYVDRSGQEMRNLRRQFDNIASGAPLASQAQLAPARDAVAAAENAFEQYKIASDVDRPARRADFEKAKAAASEALSQLKSTWQSSRPAASAENPATGPTM